jgi:hypothetical protein
MEKGAGKRRQLRNSVLKIRRSPSPATNPSSFFAVPFAIPPFFYLLFL